MVKKICQEGPDGEEDLVVDIGMDDNILHIELYTGQVLNIHSFYLY